MGIALAGALVLGLGAACDREGPVERLGEKVDDATRNNRSGAEGAAEKARDKAEDATDKVKDAVR
jgi:hypothetical protein